jgi:hypothetical protein
MRCLLLGNPEATVAAAPVNDIIDPLGPAGYTPEVRLGFRCPAVQVSAVLRLPDLLKDTDSLVLIVAVPAAVSARLNDSLPRRFLAKPDTNKTSP